jgi:hypothetical protein
MCDKCDPKKHSKYWIHLVDSWKPYEQREMLNYLQSLLSEEDDTEPDDNGEYEEGYTDEDSMVQIQSALGNQCNIMED